jgi:hypothetical protein
MTLVVGMKKSFDAVSPSPAGEDRPKRILPKFM